MRIAIAGFQHETNTFAPMLADLEAFTRESGWPGLTRGDDIFERFEPLNVPLSGFMRAARAAGHSVLPIVWTSAEPCSFVTDEAFDTIAYIILEGIRAAGDIDALYLDLHGAMVTSSYEDGEGELLRRVREQVGMELPVVVSLDLHANVTRQMVDLSDVLTIYRTYPHLDMAETGVRCLPLLERMVSNGKPQKAFVQLPFLIPLHAQYTNMPPCKQLYGMLEEKVPGAVWSADIAAGFPPADIHDAGTSIVAYGDSLEATEGFTDAIYTAFIEAESTFDASTLRPLEAVRRAMQQPSGKPIVLADVEDNPGAGATSDTTGLLHAMVEGGARGAYIGMFFDPDVVQIASALGLGKSFSTILGAKTGGPGERGFEGTFKVVALSDGMFPFTGEMMGGATAQLGPIALLQVVHAGSDIKVLVGSQRFQCLDRAMFSHLGVDLSAARILAVKSTVHFRADFEPIAQAVWCVKTPGANPSKLDEVVYTNLRRGVRLGPLGPTH